MDWCIFVIAEVCWNWLSLSSRILQTQVNRQEIVKKFHKRLRSVCRTELKELLNKIIAPKESRETEHIHIFYVLNERHYRFNIQSSTVPNITIQLHSIPYSVFISDYKRAFVTISNSIITDDIFLRVLNVTQISQAYAAAMIILILKMAGIGSKLYTDTTVEVLIGPVQANRCFKVEVTVVGLIIKEKYQISQ